MERALEVAQKIAAGAQAITVRAANQNPAQRLLAKPLKQIL